MTTETWREYVDGLTDAQRHHILVKILAWQIDELKHDGDIQLRDRIYPCELEKGSPPCLYWESCGDDLLDDFLGERMMEQIIESPQKGDMIVLVEPVTDMGEPSFDHESMIRVLGVADEHVWYKEYGLVGRTFKPLKQWMNRIRSAKSASIYKNKVE